MHIEVANLPKSFAAVVAQEKINHRGSDVGLVTAFVEKVRDHEARYGEKINNLVAAGYDPEDLDRVRGEIHHLVEQEIAAANLNGRVEMVS